MIGNNRNDKVKKIWIGDPYSCTDDLVSITKTNQIKTKFPVEVNGVIIYYASREFDRKRFFNTKRMQLIQKYLKYFEGEDK